MRSSLRSLYRRPAAVLRLVRARQPHRRKAHFRVCLLGVAEDLKLCDCLVASIEEIVSKMTAMLDGWRNTEDDGKSLQDMCQWLLDE